MATDVLQPAHAPGLASAAPAAASSAVTRGEAQALWAARPISDRLAVLRRARHELAALSSEFAAAIPANLSRTPADTLVAELMPLLDACRFLEREAASILRTRALGRRGRPFWLSGTHAEVQYAPFGTVLVIAPGNYPLFLPGVQALQALAAGNSVVWKPGRGGAPVAHLFADALFRSGLSRELLRVTPETAEAAVEEIRFGVDKVFFTGSATTGRKLLRLLADTLTPCVAELSGSDACVVLPSADLGRVVAALTFGMRLNGSETCMAPRRVLLVDATPARRELFLIQLRESLAHLPPVRLAPATRAHLDELLADAQASGATVLRESVSERTRPILVLDTRPEMAITQADLFAPLLSVLDVQGETGVLAAQRACPYALTTSIFGAEREARSLAARLETGVVTINDLIVPTADPRLPFGGRRQSGFGVTRGREGLLEMVAPRVVTVRRGRSTRHLEPVGARQQPFFAGILAATHAGSWRSRWAGLRQAFAAARNLSAQTTAPDRK